MTTIVAPAPAKIYTPENLTWADISAWDGPTMRRHMATPLRPHIIQIVSSRSLAEVQAVAADQPPEPVEVVDNAALLAEAQRLLDTQVPVVPVPEAVVPPKKKLVADYQITDDDGNPLGRPTHLEASTQEEMDAKRQEAHVQATRAFHRLKKQKITFKPEPAVVPAEMSDAAILNAIRDLKSDDPKAALAAVRAINKAESDRIKAESDAKVEETNELRRQEQVTFMFLKNHRDDYHPCEANTNLFREYFQENQLAWTVDNLEIAFNALESELAPVVKPVAPAAPVNPQPAAQPTPTTVAALPVQPVVPAPAPTLPPVNPAVIAPRPGVNGGLVPGQNSAPRPAPKTSGLTADEVRKWDGPTMRLKMKNPTLRAQILQFVAEQNARKQHQTA